MNKLCLAITTTALLTSGITFAAGDPATVVMGGSVESVCEVTSASDNLGFSNMTIGTSVSDDLAIQCNDGDGAILSMTSSSGGMASDDVAGYLVPYKASIVNPFAATLELEADGTGSDISSSITLPPSVALAEGKPATLILALQGTASWSGGYSDTLTINITVE